MTKVERLLKKPFTEVVFDIRTKRARLFTVKGGLTLDEWLDWAEQNGLKVRTVRPFGAEEWVYQALDELMAGEKLVAVEA